MTYLPYLVFALSWVAATVLSAYVTPDSAAWLKLAFILTFVTALAALMALVGRLAGQKEFL